MSPVITAHRGNLGAEPENTLRAFRRAVADGCDEIELDLRLTADDEVVVVHDATVDRTTDGTGAVEDLTLAQLRALDAGRGERIPTWAETVAAVGIRIQAEIKDIRVLPQVADSFRDVPGLLDRTLVTSSHPEMLVAMRDLLPEASTGLIMGRTPATAEIIARTIAAGATTALCGIAGLTTDAVAACHRAGLEVTAWPVPDPETLAVAVALGVDGITTDHPDRLRRSERTA